MLVVQQISQIKILKFYSKSRFHWINQSFRKRSMWQNNSGMIFRETLEYISFFIPRTVLYNILQKMFVCFECVSHVTFQKHMWISKPLCFTCDMFSNVISHGHVHHLWKSDCKFHLWISTCDIWLFTSDCYLVGYLIWKFICEKRHV